MAQFYPTLEQIDRLKEPPTPGERYLLHKLNDILSDDYKVFFQAYFNSLRPDIIIMRKGWGVVIIEVKDWRLPAYVIDSDNKWSLSSKRQRVKSPFQQVFAYKKMMFDLHINGLAEATALNQNFYKILKPFVYFHGSTKQDIDQIFRQPETKVKESRDSLNREISKNTLNQQKYDNQMDFWERKSRIISRDKGMALMPSNLHKLTKAISKQVLFTDEIYEEFKRHLQPPFHTANQGRNIHYSPKQVSFTESVPGFQKLKGVAGSGKTTVLAKRAVNAYKRHGEKVLILTFNLSLKNYIHDRVNEVREDFPWSKFIFENYHAFIRTQREVASIPNPDNIEDTDAYFKAIFSDETMFKGREGDVPKYRTIFIDEAQDFERSWLKIIRDTFLSDEGEMVLFGDEGQNIYERKVDKANAELIRGFGRWKRLTKSFRSKNDSKLTRVIEAFQTDYLVSKYDIDKTEKMAPSSPQTASLDFENRNQDILRNYALSEGLNIENTALFILEFMKQNQIHPNDLCILGSEISVLRRLDKAYRDISNEKTNRTFEKQEVYELHADRQKDLQLREAPPGGYQPQYNPDKDVALKNTLKRLRRNKKYNFHLNQGTLKISTIHSFKGLEAQNAIILLNEKETPEIVYTAITRARRNLVTITPISSNFSPFLQKHLEPGGAYPA